MLRARVKFTPLRITALGALTAAWLAFVAMARYNSDRPDIFFLAKAFSQGQNWLVGLNYPSGSFDIIFANGHQYLPFGPFPALLFAPLTFFIDPAQLAAHETLINATLATACLGLVWWLAARLGVEGGRERIFLVLLLGFSSPVWWLTVLGGVWFTTQLIALLLTLAALVEGFGRRRPWLLGFLAGAMFLTRGPLLLALPCLAFLAVRIEIPRSRKIIFKRVASLLLAFLPALLFYFYYNQIRFGSPLESGYALATLPPWLATLRAQGLFSLAHFPQNLDYFLWHLPRVIGQFPYLKPDGFGLSILLTSPALLLALRANPKMGLSMVLALTFGLVLLPDLLYYGGGWEQYGFRYALDAMPFALALCALVLARQKISSLWWGLLLLGILINAIGIYWALFGLT
jgi:hypothetical protein